MEITQLSHFFGEKISSWVNGVNVRGSLRQIFWRGSLLDWQLLFFILFLNYQDFAGMTITYEQ